MQCEGIQIKIICLILILSVATQANAQETPAPEFAGHHCFLRKTSFVVGLAVPYSFELNTAGINARIYYNINKRICFGPELARFISEEKEITELNLMVHYIFETKWVGVYPLAGANYSHEQEITTSDEWGPIAGLGTHRNFKRFTLFGEYAFSGRGLSNHFAAFGFLYLL